MEHVRTLRHGVIKQWIEDLNDDDFGIKFNADFVCVQQGRRGKLMGDGSLFLAYRQANVQSDKELVEWIGDLKLPDGGYHPSEVIVNLFTGIPLEDACALMWPSALWTTEYENPTAKDFVRVLQNYLVTGEVDWLLAIPPAETEEEKAKKEAKRASRAAQKKRSAEKKKKEAEEAAA